MNSVRQEAHEKRLMPHYMGAGPVKLMARADGYVMVRRAGCMPFVLSEGEWSALPRMEPEQ